ncbi:MAG: 3-deoxy-manno-octulosonate cytidylyltransferase [Maricaulaceae bacterium]
MTAVVLIPARLASQRLPNKPLLPVAGRALILRVVDVARAAGLGEPIVACGDAAIAEAVRAEGGRAVLTDSGLPSGTDRVRAALAEIDPQGALDPIINLQGDLPLLPAAALTALLEALAADPEAGMATLAAPSDDPEERQNPNVVKAVLARRAPPRPARALYFTRAPAPWGNGPIHHHIGVYAYRRTVLEQICALDPSPLERRERLEQLRALEAGVSIAVAELAKATFGVDTAGDLARASAEFQERENEL